MYNNVGKKIMVLAQVLGWVGLIAGIITWIVLLSNYEKLGGWLSLIGGVLSFVFSWFMYGFGQLVQDIHEGKMNAPNGSSDEKKIEQNAPQTVVSDELPDL